VAVPEWIWLVFIFAFGCCIGSFLNVVIYRLPREKSLISPPSACPACGERIRPYDNVPLVSWLLLGRKCRYCKAPISVRYFVVELLTGLVFVGVFCLYFRTDLRAGMGSFWGGGWLIYLLHIILLGAFIAASAIDLESWVIPLPICWFVTVAGLIGSTLSGYIIDPANIRRYYLLPSTSDIFFNASTIASLAFGATIGLAVSWTLLATGLVKRSYESEESGDSPDKPENANVTEPRFNHRLEMAREVSFLLPIIVCSLLAYWLVKAGAGPLSVRTWLASLSQKPAVAGLLGSLWGYFVGCGVVWATRIFGTLAFGKEAMGLGDVHLMGAAGAVTGPLFIVVAFFIAPFFGLAWAACQMFFKKTRQIPYGPFLSLGVFTVMILHDWILSYWESMRNL
jgi:leader peptidase (prepilin peptidase)/N-methyltransferase